MKIANIQSYEQLADYLRTFRNWPGEAVPYDFGGVAHLLGALLENIDSHALDAEIEEISGRLTPKQAEILRRLASQVQS